ncbi:hypothetical protein MtrunA17_Chr8g0382821 [Medicago truncatula]|uniref:Uncharacterized protein n=1 Tax=Medicago truncatula TaxID=3880 RepID=G7LAG4_MEDTR|nr:uncharacterized protein LOC11437166 [Medicago truncatula]AET04563.1 hypothetical protein MTR_8g091590 [Medicago truncatula]RHN42976.1 hypothetical protein MtrunA17_Chr8g0382821 [Medicago truncatula]
MSDIAMLVAEEYERRVKSLKNAGGAAAVETWEINMSSCYSLFVSKLKEEKRQLVQSVLEPKTQFAIAASNNFFSA